MSEDGSWWSLANSGIAQLSPETKLDSVASLLEQERPIPIERVQFDQPLPDRLMDEVAAALERHPEIRLRVYGREVDPSLAWLPRFSRVRALSLDLWHATSFRVLGSFSELKELYLGETKSRLPSLEFLLDLPKLEVLSVEGHARGFEAIGRTRSLRQLFLRVPRAKSLQALAGHPSLEVLDMDFGGIRDLGPLSDIPRLRGIGLYRIRELGTPDLDPLGDCGSLEALSLGALRNVEHLAALARKPSKTLRVLILEQLKGLQTLSHLGECEVLEELGLYGARPADGRLDHVARCKRLRHCVVGDPYPKEQVSRTLEAYRGETLWVRGKHLRGNPLVELRVNWRTPVAEILRR